MYLVNLSQNIISTKLLTDLLESRISLYDLKSIKKIRFKFMKRIFII